MSVRAKFMAQEIIYRKNWDVSKPNIGTVKLAPVCSGSAENKSFYDSTPSGFIELGTISKNALDQFELGKEYYVDFTPA